MSKSLVRIRAEGSALRATSLCILADVAAGTSEHFLRSVDLWPDAVEAAKVDVEQCILGLEWPRASGDDLCIASADHVLKLNRFLFEVYNCLTERGTSDVVLRLNDGNYDRSSELICSGEELVHIYATRVVLEYQHALMCAYTGCHRGNYGKYTITATGVSPTFITEYTEQILETWKQFRILPYFVNDGQPEVRNALGVEVL